MGRPVILGAAPWEVDEATSLATDEAAEEAAELILLVMDSSAELAEALNNG